MRIAINSSQSVAGWQQLARAIHVAVPLLPYIPEGEGLIVEVDRHFLNSRQGPQYEIERTYYGARVTNLSDGFITRALRCDATIDIR